MSAVVTTGKGLLAGLVATMALSVLMAVKTMIGVMPELDLPAMIARMLGSPGSPALGWTVHLMIGIVAYGVAIALLDHKPGRSAPVRGTILGIAGWLIMMVVLMPLAGSGLFAMSIGPMAPVMTLLLHVIFGAVLGATCGKLMHDGDDHHGRGRADRHAANA